MIIFIVALPVSFVVSNVAIGSILINIKNQSDTYETQFTLKCNSTTGIHRIDVAVINSTSLVALILVLWLLFVKEDNDKNDRFTGILGDQSQ